MQNKIMITSESEAERMWPSRDLMDEMKRHNSRVQERAAIRRKRYYEDIRQNTIHIIPTVPKESNLPFMFRGIVDRIKQVQGDCSLFHFSLQFGRLRIELSKANTGRHKND